MWIVELCIRRPVFATVLVLVMVVTGMAGYVRLGIDFFPNIEFPFIIVTTRLDGASPREVETEISEKLEDAVATTAGIDELRSASADGVSQVYAIFQLGVDPDTAAQEVRDNISRSLAELPEGIDAPMVAKMDPNVAPVIYLSLTGDRSIVEMTEFADTIVRRGLEGAPGVGAVRIVGGQKREIHVVLDPIRMRSLGVSAPEIMRSIQVQNAQVPGGSIETGPKRVNLRVQGRISALAALERLTVRTVDGAPIQLGDVADIEDTKADETSRATRDGKPAVVIAVRKQSGENTVAVVDQVLRRVPTLQASLPKGVTIEVVRNTAEAVRTANNLVMEHLVLGAILAAAVVMLFLADLRATVIATIAIPTSIITTFALVWVAGFTLNTITLLALALAVGIVIDDAIVVLENIVRFVETKNMSPREAALEATREISTPVVATTLSLIAVFAPIAFMSGIIGQFLSSFGLTMSFAIAVSMVVSFILTPSLAARWLRPHVHGSPGLLQRLSAGFYAPVEGVYIALLGFVMRHRWTVVVVSLLVFASIPVLGKVVGKSFLPLNDEAEFEIAVRAPEGSSIAETALQAERITRQVSRMPGVQYTLTTIGDDERKTANLARVYVRLTDPGERHATQAALMQTTRDEIITHVPPSLHVAVQEVPRFSAGGATQNVQYRITGPDLDTLAMYGDRVASALRKSPYATDIDTSLVLGKPELVAHIDRARASDVGVTVSDVATSLRILVGGVKASTFTDNGEQYDVRLRAPRAWRANAETLAVLAVPSSRNALVPLSDVVTFQDSTGPSTIERLSRARQVVIGANAKVGYGESDVIAVIESEIKAMRLPPGYASGPSGRSRILGDTVYGFAVAVGLAFVFMYLVLAAQFESWLDPVVILVTLPLTLPFALLSLLLFDQTLNIYSMLGVLVLFGVIKKNAILQVDYSNRLRADGMPRLDAIMEANRARLRPILMTTLAFVGGMLPMIFSHGIGSGLSRAAAGLIVGGQTMSLLLTLLAVPVVYSLIDDARGITAWLRGLIFGHAVRPPEEPVAQGAK